MNTEPLDDKETKHVLDYLRGMDYSVLDDRYELESLWRDLRMVVEPLSSVFRERAAHKPDEPAEIAALRQKVIASALDETLVIVEHYTTGAPDYLLNMETGDSGWGAAPSDGEVS